MLALWVQTPSGINVPTCGAALISSRYVITAAHCVSDTSLSYILRGGSNINRLDFTIRNTMNSFIGAGIILDIEKIVVHQDFNPFNFENDIAVIKLTNAVRFSRDLYPVCLPPPVKGRVTEYAGGTATISGWGCEREGCDLASIPVGLQETQLPIITNDLAMCWFMNDSRRRGRSEYIPSRLFIVGGDESGSTSTCRGDSGSPVVRQRKPKGPGRAGRWEVIGLVSWSKGCGRAFRPSVWTRVESYVTWILSMMNE